MPISSTAVTTDPNDVATSSSHVVTPDGGLQDVPSIRDFLNKICVELKRPPEFLESIVSAFQSEDVSSVNLLVALFGVQAQYTAMKTAVQESGLKVSAMFWALLETQLTPFIESSRPSQGPSQRRRVSTGSTGEGIGRDVNQALRAGAEAVGRVVRGAYPLDGTNAIFVPKSKVYLAKDVSGYCKFWNTEHCKVLQFSPTATKERRNSIVNYRWKLHQTPQIVARDFTKKQGLNSRVAKLEEKLSREGNNLKDPEVQLRLVRNLTNMIQKFVEQRDEQLAVLDKEHSMDLALRSTGRLECPLSMLRRL